MLVKSGESDLLLCGIECLQVLGDNVYWAVNSTTKAFVGGHDIITIKDESSTQETHSEKRDFADETDSSLDPQSDSSESNELSGAIRRELKFVQSGDDRKDCMSDVVTKLVADSRDVMIQNKAKFPDEEKRDSSHEPFDSVLTNDDTVTNGEKLVERLETSLDTSFLSNSISEKKNSSDPYEDENQAHHGKKEICRCHAPSCQIM